ncbi:MAG: response regulator transcription factor [Bacteroidia bacterium]|nr:response regulator transcription factor [Bacteroidia bacterium]
MENKPIRIIIVDDHALARESWKMVLERNPRLQVIALCDNGITAIEMAQQLIPDILLVDVNMYPVNGFAVTEKVTKANLGIKIIALSVNNQIYYVQRMLELGAKGYLTKTSPLEEVEEGILKVYAGEQYICDEIKKNLPVQQDEPGK